VSRQIGAPALLLLLAVPGCGGEARAADTRWAGFNPGPAPAEVHRGEVVFNTYCLSCHGLHASGAAGAGPALLDTLFAPTRLTDDAIISAMDRGVSQKYFTFGGMPPVQRLSRDDAAQVVGYVRWLQGRAGITDSTATPSTEVR
jgi:mono/diheme cytochrome c family protein